MAIQTITYSDKSYINENSSVADTNKIKADDMNEIKTVVNNNASLLYPVGSIYMSVNSTDPSTLFGGTWEQIEDVFLLSAGSTYTAGNTGGSATHYHKTPIGFDSSNIYGYLVDSVPAYGSEVVSATGVTVGASTTSALRIAYTEESSSLPPYLVVYMWKRTA